MNFTDFPKPLAHPGVNIASPRTPRSHYHLDHALTAMHPPERQNHDHELDRDPDQDPAADRAWDLLLRGRRVEPSPFFARNVLREVRQLADRRSRWERVCGWLFQKQRPWALAGGVAGVALLALALARQSTDAPDAPPAILAALEPGVTAPETIPPTEEVMAEEVHSVEYLGALVAVVDPSQLDDQALADLLY